VIEDGAFDDFQTKSVVKCFYDRVGGLDDASILTNNLIN